jgi:hypothetical protein
VASFYIGESNYKVELFIYNRTVFSHLFHFMSATHTYNLTENSLNLYIYYVKL